MSFQIRALPYENFAPLFHLSDEDLKQHKAIRETVVKKPGTPCRVSLLDAEPGENVLLINYTHQPAATPFHASHALYVRHNAVEAKPAINEVPPMLRSRLLSLRAFTHQGMMINADVVPGQQVETLIETMLADTRTAYIHLHNARQGCYLARLERA